MIDISDQVIGMKLKGVRRLVFDYPEEAGPPMQEGIALDFEGISVVVQTENDTSEIKVWMGDFVPDCQKDDKPYYTVQDISDVEPYSRFKTATIRNWWSMVNGKGYTDGLAIAFRPTSGLGFVAMNNIVSVFAIDGEHVA
jgi:hypothetical protein